MELTPEEIIKAEREQRNKEEKTFRKLFPKEYRSHQRSERLHRTLNIQNKQVPFTALSMISQKSIKRLWKNLTTLPMPRIVGYIASDKQFNKVCGALDSLGSTANHIKEYGHDVLIKEMGGFMSKFDNVFPNAYFICIRKSSLNHCQVINTIGETVLASTSLAYDIILDHELNHVLEKETGKGA